MTRWWAKARLPVLGLTDCARRRPATSGRETHIPHHRTCLALTPLRVRRAARSYRTCLALTPLRVRRAARS